MKFFIKTVRENHSYTIRYDDGSFLGGLLGDITFLRALRICEVRFYGWQPGNGISLIELSEISDMIRALEAKLIKKCETGDIS